MKKTYSDEVIYLSVHTGLSKYRCKVVLDESGGDINEAFLKLSEIAGNKYEKAMDNISAIVRGERGSVVTINEGGEALFRMPCVILILLLLILDIPSWVIAVVLLLLVVFGTQIDMSFVEKNDELIRTVNINEYKKQKKIAMKISKGQSNSPKTSEDGYNEIIIE